MNSRNLIIAGICLIIFAVHSYSKDEIKLDESIVALINPQAECLRKENHYYIPVKENNTSDSTIISLTDVNNPCKFGFFYVCIPNFTNVSQNKLIKSFEIKPDFAKRTYDSYVNENFDKMYANNSLDKKITLRLALKINF